MTEIRHIVFDIGKVLLHYDPSLPFNRLIPDAAERQWFFDNVCTSDWNVEQDRGRTWEEAEGLLLGRHPDHAENIRNFRRHWHEMVPHAYDDSVALMEGLIDEGRDVTMLTNFASDTFREAQERFPFLKLPRGVTVSGDIKLIKPDRAIYDHHIRSFDLEPAATLFIDDSPKNVEGAKKAGWQAVLFTDAATLKRDLAARGVEA
ncbi:MAG TPA: HAD family phosphatase [Mesorhizobium sp.]|jgi:2-haloacid dehalogenase|uniref:HAD family hydrolase n=1 Tax=Mesorhizobium sp. TaxID=1871066 RepID=UPI002DDDB7AC|nr:HAD family phosphatase [Mesorhizobium sp.]HEV2503113.1 HAD family phosphatase [Mesorhizobium sp.]